MLDVEGVVGGASEAKLIYRMMEHIHLQGLWFGTAVLLVVVLSDGTETSFDYGEWATLGFGRVRLGLSTGHRIKSRAVTKKEGIGIILRVPFLPVCSKEECKV